MEAIDHTNILKALRELPFRCGKTTLVDIVSGAVNSKMVSNDTYMDLPSYGSLEHHSRSEIEVWVDKLIQARCIRITALPDKPYVKLLELTGKGMKEIKKPSLSSAGIKASFTGSEIDEETQALIDEFSFFLKDYNEQQQHAIVCPAQKALCVAGAGGGKTTVLTKRAEFLVKYRGVKPKEVLAITFTRKARAEMRERLSGIPIDVVTFNGLCERELRRANIAKPLISWGQKRSVFMHALQKHDLQLPVLIHEYFSPAQRRGATNDELTRRLMNDVYSIIDHFSNMDQPVPHSGRTVLASQLLHIASEIVIEMDRRGVADYSHQLTSCLQLFRENPNAIPRYRHVLVDEYQDVNPGQVELLKLLNPEFLFVVGDPRQSIFGWRGSKVEFITKFDANVTIQLTKNYRSQKQIINVMNKCISRMKLPNLNASRDGSGAVQKMTFRSETEERNGIAALLANMKDQDVFVLARTNAQLTELSQTLTSQKVAHSIRYEGDEDEKPGVTLSTVHAIKGLEATAVIVMGCSGRYFPCKVSDHPVIDLIKDEMYDREAEEMRLLYVALSRARDTLIVTYSGSASYFLDDVIESKVETKKKKASRNDGLYEQLRSWRSAKAKERGLPAYTIVSDKTLRQITEVLPSSLDELQDVYGMGPAKINQFGEEILNLL